jgi:hypothetical protein
MAWLLRTPKPRCGEAGCHKVGLHVVRSVMMRKDDDVDLGPRCLRHAKVLVAWYEQRELAAGLDADGLPLVALAAPAADTGA